MIKNLQNNMFLVCRDIISCKMVYYVYLLHMDLVPLIYGMINIKKNKKESDLLRKKNT